MQRRDAGTGRKTAMSIVPPPWLSWLSLCSSAYPTASLSSGDRRAVAGRKRHERDPAYLI